MLLMNALATPYLANSHCSKDSSAILDASNYQIGSRIVCVPLVTYTERMNEDVFKFLFFDMLPSKRVNACPLVVVGYQENTLFASISVFTQPLDLKDGLPKQWLDE